MSEKNIVGPDGKIALTEETKQKMEALKLEVTTLMENASFRKYAEALVLGTQLYAWAHHYIQKELEGSEQAKQIIIETVIRTMHLPDGNPRPFDEQVMLKNLEDLKSFVGKKVKSHVADAKIKKKSLADTIKSILMQPAAITQETVNAGINELKKKE